MDSKGIIGHLYLYFFNSKRQGEALGYPNLISKSQNHVLNKKHGLGSFVKRGEDVRHPMGHDICLTMIPYFDLVLNFTHQQINWDIDMNKSWDTTLSNVHKFMHNLLRCCVVIGRK